MLSRRVTLVRMVSDSRLPLASPIADVNLTCLFTTPQSADRTHRREHAFCADSIPQHADALDLRFDHVLLQEAAIFEPYAARRAGKDQIPGRNAMRAST